MKFAFLSLPKVSGSVIRRHPVLKRLPPAYARRCLKYISAQVSGSILDRDTQTELGFMLEMPGFFSAWDKLSSKERMHQLWGLVHRMERLQTTVVSFPYWGRYLTESEAGFLRSCGLVLLNGRKLHLAALLKSAEILLGILYKELPAFDVGVWGADTEAGWVWAEALAWVVNRMTIGGRDRKTLDRLQAGLLKTTGLSCAVTQSPVACLERVHLSVLAEPETSNFPMRRPTIQLFTYPEAMIDKSAQAEKPWLFQIQGGWLTFPEDLGMQEILQPPETLALLDALFYSVSRVYREELLPGGITISELRRMNRLIDLYPLKPLGYLSEDGYVSFERFRREYFQFCAGQSSIFS